MKKKSISQSAFFSLRALIAAAVVLASASLGGFFATADQPTRASGSAKWPRTSAAPGGTGPVVVGTTLIRGPDRAYQPGASFADLDHGFAAGATRDNHTFPTVTRSRHNAEYLLPASDHSGREQGGWQRGIPGLADPRGLGR